jgi:hypothetical protein
LLASKLSSKFHLVKKFDIATLSHFMYKSPHQKQGLSFQIGRWLEAWEPSEPNDCGVQRDSRVGGKIAAKLFPGNILHRQSQERLVKIEAVASKGSFRRVAAMQCIVLIIDATASLL